MSVTLPWKITVKKTVASRYGCSLANGESRPLSWDDRVEGFDTIETSEGVQVKLYSDGGQSVPQAGWVLLLTTGDEAKGYGWTLFGMPKGVEAHTA